jgi:hypothetical protein
MSDSVDLITCHSAFREGFVRPDWEFIARNIDENCEEVQRHYAWNGVLEAWLETIIEALGDRYWLGVSKNFLIVSSEAEHYVENLAQFLENALCTIMQTLDGIAAPGRYGKHVVILFDKDKDFFRYISDYYPEEGQFASPAGIFLSRGLGHFVLPHADIQAAERVVAHELCHACVAHLPIPLWLNEGIAQTMEDVVLRRHHFTTDEWIMDRHCAFWGEEEIQQFWSGESFHRPDEGQELSYHLARLAMGALSHDYAAFKRFVLSANRKDAGEAAVEEVYGGSLGDLMEQFLGSGNWEPAPEKWTYTGDHDSSA